MMKILSNLEPARVFHYFEEISAIPRGSGHMEAISRYCMAFAEAHGLRAIRDEANNVIIYKEASCGYEKSKPVILQGHLDIVCQKDADSTIDFENEGLTLYTEGDYIRARGTTLGADNGIAVAMILSVLESDSLAHPPLEAVFTTDEEIGMIGAGKLSMNVLKGKKMINLDAEDPETITVSCAGGICLKMTLPYVRKAATGRRIKLVLQGLIGGHSGVEIDKGRVNANVLMGRILNHCIQVANFSIISVDGGDRDNVITNRCVADLVASNADALFKELEAYLAVVKAELADREPNFAPQIQLLEQGEFEVLADNAQKALIFALGSAPSGVIDMSMTIAGLVETSLNLGVLKTEKDNVAMTFSIRSNKSTAMTALLEKMQAFAGGMGFSFESYGYYPPWEFKDHSELQALYKQIYKKHYGREPIVTAIHAGLECGIFAAGIQELDCIAIGPRLEAVHTTGEQLSISSTKETYELLTELLERCK